jgi:hypothetical protein
MSCEEYEQRRRLDNFTIEQKIRKQRMSKFDELMRHRDKLDDLRVKYSNHQARFSNLWKYIHGLELRIETLEGKAEADLTK